MRRQQYQSGQASCTANILVPSCSISFIFGPGGRVIKELQSMPGISAVEVDKQAGTVVIRGHSEGAVQAVKKRVHQQARCARCSINRSAHFRSPCFDFLSAVHCCRSIRATGRSQRASFANVSLLSAQVPGTSTLFLSLPCAGCCVSGEEPRLQAALELQRARERCGGH